MAKFVGIIGFGLTSETEPGVWVDQVVERPYTGDVLRNTQAWNREGTFNPDVITSDTISIVADGFTTANLYSMKYVRWRGILMAVKNVRLERPRVILEIGGLYNGPTAGSS